MVRMVSSHLATAADVPIHRAISPPRWLNRRQIEGTSIGIASLVRALTPTRSMIITLIVVQGRFLRASGECGI